MPCMYAIREDWRLFGKGRQDKLFHGHIYRYVSFVPCNDNPATYNHQLEELPTSQHLDLD